MDGDHLVSRLLVAQGLLLHSNKLDLKLLMSLKLGWLVLHAISVTSAAILGHSHFASAYIKATVLRLFLDRFINTDHGF